MPAKHWYNCVQVFTLFTYEDHPLQGNSGFQPDQSSVMSPQIMLQSFVWISQEMQACKVMSTCDCRNSSCPVYTLPSRRGVKYIEMYLNTNTLKSIFNTFQDMLLYR